MPLRIFKPVVFFCVVAGLLMAAGGAPVIIDDCRYRDDAAAQAAWQPMRGSAPASVGTLDGQKVLRLPCNFAGTQFERASWDRKVDANLLSGQGIQFKLFAKNLSPVARFSIYFQSGGGWYSTGFYPEAPGEWNTITIDKSSTRVEGSPAGWGSIQKIRISAFRAHDEDTEFYISDMRVTGVLGADASVAILRADSAAQTGAARSAEEYADNVAQSLRAAGIGSTMLSDLEVAADQLRQAKLVILPNNPGMPDAVVEELSKYLSAGGKLLAFYGLPAKLGPLVKIENGTHIKARYPGYFSAMRFTGNTLPGAPPLVGQQSWNIVEARPVTGASRVLAEWLDDKGQPTGHAAVVGSDNCIVMTHVLLKDDPANKRRLLLAMVGRLAPDLWRQAVNASIQNIGHIAGYRNFEDAAPRIARASSNDKRVLAGIESARQLRQQALALGGKDNFPEASEHAAAASQRLAEAFYMAQRPQPGEFRAFWCHKANGVQGMEWDEAIKHLADNGFTAILPNMLWGGTAYYPSKVLPVASGVAETGDQIAKCLAACKKYGIQMHVWKVNWNLGSAPAEFVAKMRAEARLQSSSSGEEERWLCPSHPENQKLEVAAMVEVARNYDVDGIHFDYIRYPNADRCFCAGCRARFAKAAGVSIQHWPQDVAADGPFRQQWLDWRRSNITTVVKAVSEQARAVKPKIKISAAVFRNWAVDRDGVGQDWKLWCEKGYLDFVCPMDYTASDRQFETWIASQKEWAGKVPVYPGIGASSSSSHLEPDRVIGQIQITRRYKTGGFVIFNYNANEAKGLVPLLGLGITAKR